MEGGGVQAGDGCSSIVHRRPVVPVGGCWVCAGVQQRVHNTKVSERARTVQRSPAIVVHMDSVVRIHPIVEQKLFNLRLVAASDS